MAELKAKDTTQKDMSAFFMQYVAKRNISIMTKAEWEQLYFYCTVRALTHKHLAELKTDDLYAVAKHLSLTFSQVNTLLKKSYRLELEEHEEKESAPGDFKALFSQHAILKLNIVDGNCIAFEILNSVVKEQVMEIIARNNIFADTSFNRNVVKISYDGYLKLIGQDPASILAQLKSCLSTIADDIKKLNPKHKKNGADSSKEKDKELLKEALDMINNDRMVKSVGKLVKVLSSVYGVASGDVGHIIFNRIRAFKNTNIPSECLTFDELSYA